MLAALRAAVSASRNTSARTTGQPVTNFKCNTKLYNQAMSHNKGSTGTKMVSPARKPDAVGFGYRRRKRQHRPWGSSWNGSDYPFDGPGGQWVHYRFGHRSVTFQTVTWLLWMGLTRVLLPIVFFGFLFYGLFFGWKSGASDLPPSLHPPQAST